MFMCRWKLILSSLIQLGLSKQFSSFSQLAPPQPLAATLQISAVSPQVTAVMSLDVTQEKAKIALGQRKLDLGL